MNYLQNKAALPTDLKQRNRREILKAFQNSPKEEWTLSEISDFTGISRATVAKAIATFVKKDVLRYNGKGNSTEIGGKKPDIFSFNSEYQFLAYLNIGIGTLEMSILDLKLEEKASIHAEIAISSSVEIIIKKSQECYQALLKKSLIPESKIYGLCISTSGMINQETGVINCNLSYTYWGNDIPFKAMFEKAYPSLKILVENVARAAGRAELYYNRELKTKKVFTVFTFRGISGCLIEQGQIQNSKNSLIGEIGHMIICPDDTEQCRCGSRGCFENMVSEERVLKNMNSYPEMKKGSILENKENIQLKDILQAANTGDIYAQKITNQAAWYFAMAFRNIILTVDPEVIIIQGIYASGGTYFLKKIKEYLYNQAYFPKTSDWTFLYDERNIWQLAKTGLAATMVNDLFQNRELYQD